MEQQILFKYLDCNGAAAMLANSNIQFTNATKLNDPFDCHPGLIDYSKVTADNITSEMLAKIEFGYYPSFFRDYTYVCSLSKNFDSILMWSYYTKEHKGVCLGLDMRNVKKYVRYIHFDVQYPDNLTKYDYSLGTNKEAFRHQLATKAPEWKHENEVRLLGEPLSQNEDYCRYKIGGECFFSIYLGANIDKEEKRR